ncbi:YHYH protein [Oceanospirillum beijerinckii]|uniref:YHYH protein n=1 Tax=Oceanospirillum beijerinckii TaxID=64976 RepID=UPI0004168EF7|nr:YHYH protein [Oceanospirillum beijerinckii]
MTFLNRMIPSAFAACALSLSIGQAIASNDTTFVQRGITGKGAGDDTYVFSPNLVDVNASITVSDTQGSNVIQLTAGLEVSSSRIASDSLELTLSNGAVVTVLGASSMSYMIGGDPLSGQSGNSYDYSSFVSNILSVAVPSSGVADGGSATLNTDGASEIEPPPADPVENNLTLSSPALKSAAILPMSATCDGADNGRMIPLQWSGVPAGTQSLALTMHHFPNPDDTDISGAHSYLVLYDIQATETEMEEAETDIGVLGTNSVNDQQSFSAPCSKGTGDNEYIITLHALSTPPGGLGLTGSSTDLQTFFTAASGSTLATKELKVSRIRYNPANDDHVPTSVPSTCEEKQAAASDYNHLISISCSSSEMVVSAATSLPERSLLNNDKENVGIQAWIGRVPLRDDVSWSVPMNPVYLSQPTSNINIHHPIGIAVDGIPILHYAKENEPDEIAQLGQDYSDRDTILLGEVDQCGAHAGNGEDYHYHMAPVCMMDTHNPSQPIAWMFDGIPLYYGTGGGQMTTEGTDYGSGRYTHLNYLPQAVQNGSASLDECNAYDLHGDGSEYVYYTTAAAPYTIGCYRAQASQSGSIDGPRHFQGGNRLDDFTFGTEVTLTDYDTMTFNSKTWQFVTAEPKPENKNIPQENTAQLIYRLLEEGEEGYQAGLDCYTFRYRIDATQTDGSGDTVTTHCR